MITGTVLGSGPGYRINDVRCAHARSPRFAPEPPASRHALVVVRRGAFARRTRGAEVLHDATTGYFAVPDAAEEFAHPVDGGDVCTSVHLDASLAAGLAGGDPGLNVPDLPMDAASGHAIRTLIMLAERGDPTEHLVLTIAGLLARRFPERVASGRPSTAAARRRLVATAREILHAEPRAGLIEVAQRVGCSPHHLSRTFSELTGAGFSRYRNQIRVAEALERLVAGEADLAALAAELGFADQSHLTRTVRALTGRPPGAWRVRAGLQC